jgi:hypothetical protein
LLVYTYVTSRPHPENFLPFIGALVGGADTHTSAAVFVFDPRGTLKSAHTTTSTVGTGFGGGASAAQPAAAPAMPVAPAASAGAPVVVERVQTPTVQTIEPLPEQPAQPALDDGLEAPEDSVQPQAPEQ